MNLSIGTILLVTAVAVVAAIQLVVGVRRWTGRSTEWANPYRPNVGEIFLIGRSPLTLIFLSMSLLAFCAGALASTQSRTLAYVIWLLIAIPCFVLFILTRFASPLLLPPPWTATHDWGHHSRHRSRRKHPKRH